MVRKRQSGASLPLGRKVDQMYWEYFAIGLIIASGSAASAAIQADCWGMAALAVCCGVVVCVVCQWAIEQGEM